MVMCKKCLKDQPLDQFSTTSQECYALQADGKRYKLDMCKGCRRAYNKEKKREQRQREANAINAARKRGQSEAFVLIRSKAPVSTMHNKIEGESLRRLVIPRS